MQQPTTSTRKLVDAGELAEALSISRRTVWTMVSRGAIRPYRLTAAAFRFDLEEVLQDLRQQREVRDAQ